jgi:uncharacterized membrane protein
MKDDARRDNSSLLGPIARVLRGATWAAVALLVLALALHAVRGAGPPIDVEAYQPAPEHLRGAGVLARSLSRAPADAKGWLQLGVIALVLVPVVRVGAVAILAARHRRTALLITSLITLVGLAWAWW